MVGLIIQHMATENEILRDTDNSPANNFNSPKSRAALEQVKPPSR